jgi:hypothetical protein
MVFVTSVLCCPVLRACGCAISPGERALSPISLAFVPHNHHARLDRARSSRK